MNEPIIWIDELEEFYQKRALISVLSQIRDRVNAEIKGRCNMAFSSGRMIGILERQNIERCRQLRYDLERDYPFIHSLSDKDRESGHDILKQVTTFDSESSNRTLTLFNNLFPLKMFLSGSNSMSRNEREANNKPKRLNKGK